MALSFHGILYMLLENKIEQLLVGDSVSVVSMTRADIVFLEHPEKQEPSVVIHSEGLDDHLLLDNYLIEGSDHAGEDLLLSLECNLQNVRHQVLKFDSERALDLLELVEALYHRILDHIFSNAYRLQRLLAGYSLLLTALPILFFLLHFSQLKQDLAKCLLRRCFLNSLPRSLSFFFSTLILRSRGLLVDVFRLLQALFAILNCDRCWLLFPVLLALLHL